MKKNYALITGLIFLSSVGFSQSLLNSNQIDRGTPKLTEGQDMPALKNKQPKALGDTIFYEDFANQIPAGWTTQNAANNNNDWIWSSAAPGGQYSTNILGLNATTSGNGYMSLPADLYNTPFPPGGPVPMDAWFTSPAFPISPQRGSVIIKFEHYQRYCCNAANDLVLEVSNDGTTWVTFDATGGRGPNTATPNGEELNINVSNVLGYQSTGYLRFRSTANSHYFWMIDDVLVYEGPANKMELEDFTLTFHPSYDITPIYRILPLPNVPATTYTGETFNAGANTQTNVDLNVDVIMDSTIGGGPGAGLVYSASAVVGSSIASGQRDTTDVTNPFFSFNAGWYRNRVYVTSDSVNQQPQDAEGDYTFALTAGDTTVALDRGPAFYNGSSGPSSYVGGGQDNDAIGALMIVEPTTSVLATSISVWIANRTENDQVSISPRIWPFHEDSATLNGAVRPPIATSPFSTTIDTSMFGTWVNLPIFPPASIGAGAYMFGVEQTGGGSVGAEIWLGRDGGQENIAPAFSNIFFLNEPGNPRWISPPRLLGVRFHGVFATSVGDQTETNSNFSVYPNPNNGLFTMEVSSTTPSTYIMNVRNMVGQTVMSEAVNVNGTATKQLDLSNFDKGVYFVSLERGSERLVKKVIVK